MFHLFPFSCFYSLSGSSICRQKMVTNKVELLMVLTFAVTPFRRTWEYQFSVHWGSPSSPCVFLIVCLYLSHTVSATSHPLCFTPPLLLCICLWQGTIILNHYLPPSASILMYICEERVPALLIRSTAPLKELRRERWRYLLLSTCPLRPPTVQMINDVSHIRGPLSDRDTPTKQSQG